MPDLDDPKLPPTSLRQRTLSALDPTTMARRQREVLEDLFGRTWFDRPREHPAYRRWLLCKTLEGQQGQLRFPEQGNQLHETLTIFLDTVLLIDVTSGDSEKFKLGNLATYGEDEVQTKIKSRIGNRVQFDSLMVELYVGAWHQMRNGRTVTPLERSNFPDLQVVGDDFGHPVLFECKRLRSLSKNRVESDVKDASRQLGEAPDPAYRVLILDVTEAIGIIKTELRPPPSLDPIPESVLAISSLVEGALRGNKNKSVELAIIVWDDYLEAGSPIQGGTFFALRRRTHALVHPAHRGKVKEPNKFFDGFSVFALVLWQPRSV